MDVTPPTMQIVIPRYTYCLALASLVLLALGLLLQAAAHRIASVGVRTERIG